MSSPLLCRVYKQRDRPHITMGADEKFGGRVLLRRSLSHKIHGFDTNASHGWRVTGDLFSALEVFTAEDFKDVDGEFVGFLWDDEKDMVAVVSDKMGIFPVFYCQHKGTWLFSTHASVLLTEMDRSPNPNKEYLARYLMQNFAALEIPDATLFEGIHRLPASHYALIDGSGKLEVRRYWDFSAGRAQSITANDAMDEFRQLLFSSVNDRLSVEGKTGISVSGGLDSSSVFSVAGRLSSLGSRSLQGISYVSEHGDSDERSFLQDVEYHSVRSIDQFPIVDHLGFCVAIADQVAAVEAPFTDQLWGVTSTLYERAKAQNCSRLLSGHWGDQVLFCISYLSDLLASGQISAFRSHYAEIPKWLTTEEWRFYKKIIWRKVVKNLVPQLIPFVKKLNRWRGNSPVGAGLYTSEFGKLATQGSTGKLWDGTSASEYQADLYLQARSRYHQDCLDWNFKVSSHFGMDIRFPFYDHRLISFLLKIPGELQNIDGRPRGILRDSLKGLIPESVRNRTWKSDFSEFVNRTLKTEMKQIEAVLGKNALVFELGILDPKKTSAAITRMVANMRKTENCTDAWAIADLVALEIWLKTYIKGDKSWQTKDTEKIRQSESASSFHAPKSNDLGPSPN
jgi:asparagine synthase (glutamine-hydrolysing)